MMTIDAVGLEERAADLAKRSIKKQAKIAGLKIVIACMDLTTLEGKDTLGRVAQLCSKAVTPDARDPSLPSVAAVCVYPSLVEHAKRALKGAPVKVASVATGFPAGQTSEQVKVAETREVVAAGADEVDMVIDRGAFLAGRYAEVAREIAAVKDACGPAHLKVILETG